MQEIRAHLDRIRSDAAECVLLSNLVADGKREVFARAAEHLNALALEVEKTIAANSADQGTRGEGVNTARPEDREETAPVDLAATHQQQAARSRRILAWLLVVVLGGILGAFIWTKYPAEQYWSLLTLQSKRETSPAPQDETKQAIAALLSGAQADRRTLIEKLNTLVARVDNLATALDDLKATRAEAGGQLNKGFVGSEEKPPAEEIKPPAPEDKPVRREENRSSAVESSTTAKLSDGLPAASETPLIETSDRVGAVRVAPKRAELDSRRSSIGPAGCTQFRSFDPVSGTYTTLEGRRRPCRQ